MEARVQAATSGSLQNPRWNFDRAKLFQNLPLIAKAAGPARRPRCGSRRTFDPPNSSKVLPGSSVAFHGRPR
jgi:hypothetical protein